MSQPGEEDDEGIRGCRMARDGVARQDPFLMAELCRRPTRAGEITPRQRAVKSRGLSRFKKSSSSNGGVL